MDGRPRSGAQGHSVSVGHNVIVYHQPWRGEKSIAPELLDAHYREIASFQDAFKLDPDWDKYDRLDREGKLGFLRADAYPLGKMIGYLAFVCEPHMHYKGTVIAVGDVHYVHPNWRRQGVARRLIYAAEQTAKRNWGAKFFVLRRKVDHPHGDLYADMGYVDIDITALKRL